VERTAVLATGADTVKVVITFRLLRSMSTHAEHHTVQLRPKSSLQVLSKKSG
jgi:hypothetical protein